MKQLLALLFLLICTGSYAQKRYSKKEKKAIQQIESIIRTQSEAWNKGDLEGFMKGYWNSDSLLFIGSKGLTYGWKNTLSNYTKSYPDTKAMGKLTFTKKQIKVLSKKYVYYIGGWHLEREAGDLGGHFDLLWKKIDGDWKIIADHSS